jgi:putative integral membrane protein (TIGR02587 family)
VTAQATGSPWTTEATDLARAASGGLLFGIPLLYTMEVWWTGSHTRPIQGLAALAVAAGPVFLLHRTEGFRSSGRVRGVDAAMDTVETLAVGLVLVTVVLVVLREITGSTPLEEAVGKVVYEAVPFAIGAGVAKHLFRQRRDEPDDGSRPSGRLDATAADLGATTIGAVFVSLNIAPTDEVPMLAAAMGPQWLLALVGLSLAVSYLIVFVAGFAGQERRRASEGLLQHPLTETIACYVVALVASGAMLWFFQRAEGPWHLTLTHVVVLGMPASVGGAAGRLAI